jgi:hypothetical protein
LPEALGFADEPFRDSCAFLRLISFVEQWRVNAGSADVPSAPYFCRPLKRAQDSIHA